MRFAAFAAAALAALGIASGPVSTRVPTFSHIVVIVFENKEQSSVIGNPDAPTFTRYAHAYANLTHYDAVTHPSLPNYLALISGSTHGITDDCTTCLVTAPNLADTLDAAHLSWKIYAEGLPRKGFTGASAGAYAKKHDPFVYFRDVLASRVRLARVVPFSRLERDLRMRRLPRFALVLPNLCHSMHDCSVSVGDRWLRGVLPMLLHTSAMSGGVVFVIFDEGTSLEGGGGRIPAFAAGPLVIPHSQDATPTSHYGLLRTIEEAWGLPYLGQSGRAAPITGIWRLTR